VSGLDIAMVVDVLVLVLLCTNTVVLVFELRQLGRAASLREYVWEDMWNQCDLAGIVALYVASVSHFCDGEYLLQQVGALGVLLNAFSLLKQLRPFEWGEMGPLIKTVLTIMGDIKGYLVITLILLTGFSASFAVSMPDNEAFLSGVTGPLVGLLTSYEAVVGSFHMSDYKNNEARAAFLIFLFLIVVVMLNLLIAIMSDSYEKVKDSEVVEARKLTAQTIIEEETMMSVEDRQKTEFFPEFLEVLQATDEPEEIWSGVSGQISKLGVKVDEKVDNVDEKIDSVDGKVEKLATQMIESNEKAESMEGKVDKLAAEISELKELMKALVDSNNV